MSREKGARGEREVVTIATDCGLRAERQANLQASGQGDHSDVALLDIPTLHLEVKRDERMSVDTMLRQAEKDAGLRVPVVIWRRNKRKWRADVPLEDYFKLLRVELDARDHR